MLLGDFTDCDIQDLIPKYNQFVNCTTRDNKNNGFIGHTTIWSRVEDVLTTLIVMCMMTVLILSQMLMYVVVIYDDNIVATKTENIYPNNKPCVIFYLSLLIFILSHLSSTRYNVPWLTSTIRRMCRKKRRLYLAYRRAKKSGKK